MPWPFFIPEFLKRRACRYLLHHYLGQYLGGKISLDDLSIDLYNGTGSLSNVPLNIEAINEVLDDISAPVHVVSGYIGCVSVTIPWSSLMKESCTVKVTGLNIAVSPSGTHYGSQGSMTDSLFFSMSTSYQLAEEVMKNSSDMEEEEEKGAGGTGFEGMEALAKAIETVLLKVQIELLDTTVSICHQSKDKGSDLSFRIARIEFFDEMAKVESNSSNIEEREDSDETAVPQQKDYATKIFQLSGLQIELSNPDSSSSHARNMSDSLFSDEDVPVISGHSTGTPIATASGDVNVTVKMRHVDTIEAPKLDIGMVVGAVHILLYPQQLQRLIDLISDISDKVKQSMPSSHHQQQVGGGPAPGLNRPIPQQAMRTIETQLLQHIESQRQLKQAERERRQLDPWDITSHTKQPAPLSSSDTNIDTASSEVFYSFDLNSADTAGGIEDGETRGQFGSETIFNQRQVRSPHLSHIQFGGGVGLQQLSSPQSSPRCSRRAPGNRKSSEEETCRYTLTLSGVTLALLESNPVHTYTQQQQRATESSISLVESDVFSSVRSHASTTGGMSLSSMEYCSMDEGGLDPVKYFSSVQDILHGRVGRYDVMRQQEQLGRVLPADHLFLWMSTVRAGIITEGATVDVDVSIASSEILEFLYHNEANIPDIKPISVQPLLQLMEDSKNSRPCLKMKITSSSSSSSSKAADSTVAVELKLLHVQLYLDVTLMDRLHPLLHPPGHSPSHPGTLSTAHSQLHNQFPPQALFTHAMATGSASHKEQRINVKVTTESLNFLLRFPVADLSQTVRPPWYRPPLRTEVLYVDIAHLSVSSLFLSPLQRSTSIAIQMKSAKVYLSLDGSEENKTLFLVLGAGTETEFDSELNKISIRLSVNQFEDSPLDEHPLNIPISDTEDDFDVKLPAIEPSPFSQRKEYFSGPGKSHGELSEELLLPATHEEAISFSSHVMTTSTYTLSISIPTISVHIPSKLFLETFYNRIATDLALWEPASPASMERATARSMFYSSADILQPAVSKDEKFKLCQSVLIEEPDDDDDDESLSQGSNNSDHTSCPTYLSVSLSVARGCVSLILPMKESANVPSSSYEKRDVSPDDPRLLDLSPQRTTTSCFSSTLYPSEMGLLTLEFRGGSVCTAIEYKGENGCTELCFNVDTVELKHCSSIQHVPFCHQSSLQIDFKSLPLHNVLKLWDRGYSEGEGLLERNGRGDKEPMISLAIESKTESDANRRVHKCAVKINEALFEFHVTSLEDSLVRQVGDMLTLRDCPVPGYDPPTVITELHVSLQHSAVQYRPLYISTHAVLTLDSVRLASTLVTGSPLLVVKLLVDETSLFLSDKQHQSIQLRNDFVCVIDIGSFEFILRLCNKSEPSELLSAVPAVDFQCSGSELRFMMCIDSCQVFRDLLVYLADCKDIQPQYTVPGSHTGDEKESHVLESIVSNGGGASDTYTVGDLISEAMEDDDHCTTDQSVTLTSPVHAEQHTSKYIFSSDSEEEETITSGVKRDVSGGGKLSSTDDWVIDEDDYCILSSPTTAKVGPGSVPVVKCLLNEEEQLTIVENYFPIPDQVVDQLKRPRNFPDPDMIYSLRELTIIFYLFGGRDFSLPPSPSPSPSLKRSAVPAKTKKGASSVSRGQQDWKSLGGISRDKNTLVEIEINKLRLQHETYPNDTLQSSRFVFLIHDVEIRDRLAQSLMNKFLYQYSTETLPRQSHSNMFSLKILFTRPESAQIGTAATGTVQSVSPSLQGLEASIKMSLLPLRLNIDQDTFLFLHDYFQQLFPSDAAPINHEGSSTSTTAAEFTDRKPTPIQHKAEENSETKVFIKSFVFYPDTPIRIDYEAKRLLSEQLGTFAGILLGLSHLDNSEVTLKSISYKQGILGWDQLIEQVTGEWLQDIGTYQLPRILQGVGPMYHVTQLFQGVVDLFWLPIQQYQEDGRIMWGLQRGTNSFASSSGVAVVELTNRVLYSVQSLAQTAFTMVSPGTAAGQIETQNGPHQSADLREGFVNAYNVVTTGLGDTAWDLYQAASTEHTDHGITGAVGGVLRQIPGNVFRPIIYASEATRHVLGGVKNQFVPEARKEATEKWKTKQ